MTLQQTINSEVLGKVIAETLVSIQRQFESNQLTEISFKRWINAIGKAAVEFETNPFLSWDSDSKHLIIWSKSNEIYEANGTCQCRAFEQGLPCYHRALARLIQRYFERIH
jgi:hypothetical protein